MVPKFKISLRSTMEGDKDSKSVVGEKDEGRHVVILNAQTNHKAKLGSLYAVHCFLLSLGCLFVASFKSWPFFVVCISGLILLSWGVDRITSKYD